MAYAASGLDSIILGQRKLHLYQSVDAMATIIASGYFNAAVGRLNRNDTIIATSEKDTTPDVQILRVSSADNAVPVTTVAEIVA